MTMTIRGKSNFEKKKKCNNQIIWHKKVHLIWPYLKYNQLYVLLNKKNIKKMMIF